MKREEKNQQSRQKILESALAEFAAQGYGLSSINTICTTGGISKGILYHYYKDKDDLYLSCIKECFAELSRYLRDTVTHESGEVHAQLEAYFTARLAFFGRHPLYGRLFCEAVISPPAHLREAIREGKAEFDALNEEILGRLLESARLRSDITKAEAVDIFRQYQDFVNARQQAPGPDGVDMAGHEAQSRRALDILFYGIVAREGEKS